MSAGIQSGKDRVVIAVDPHKGSWTAVAVDGSLQPLTRRLRAENTEVIDVPAKLATRVRVLSVGHGRKNDNADAV